AKMEQRQAEAERKAQERQEAKAQAQSADEREKMGRAIVVFKDQPDRKLTARMLRDATGWNNDTAKRILYLLQEGSYVKPVPVVIIIGNGATREFPGFELIDDGRNRE